jgi:hypothetical protein
MTRSHLIVYEADTACALARQYIKNVAGRAPIVPEADGRCFICGRPNVTKRLLTGSTAFKLSPIL